MTKPKQDSKADPAEAPVAASAGADASADADATEPSQAAAETTADDGAEQAGQPDIDDMKAKFREALDRKRQVHADGQGKGGHESGKVNGAHGPAASRRNFRRKSG